MPGAGHPGAVRQVDGAFGVEDVRISRGARHEGALRGVALGVLAIADVVASASMSLRPGASSSRVGRSQAGSSVSTVSDSVSGLMRPETNWYTVPAMMAASAR